MNRLLEDLEILKERLTQGRDPTDWTFSSPEISDLATALRRRYSQMSNITKTQSRQIRSTNVSLNKARLEKEQYKSSLSELQKILDLCRVIASSQDLKEILHHLLFLLSEILPSRGCAVFVGKETTAGSLPILSSNFTPQLQQILVQHFEEGIIHWICNERRVCLIPCFEDNANKSESDSKLPPAFPGNNSSSGPAAMNGTLNDCMGWDGDFAIIPLNENDGNYGFIWIACTIKQEDVTPETSNLIWVLSSQASIAILNCLHRQRMEEKINELNLLTSINGIKTDLLRLGVPRDESGPAFGGPAAGGHEPSGLAAFYRSFQSLVSRELKLDFGFLIPEQAGNPLPTLDGAPFLEHGEARKLMRLADKDQVRIESSDFFHSGYPHMAKALGSQGLAVLSLSPGPGPADSAGGAGYLLLRLHASDLQRMPMLQGLLKAVASQARLAAENMDLYDSLLNANRNLTALQWQLVHAGKMAALGQLAGGVAHEINNPLQIMLGRIQMIQLMSEGKSETNPGKLKDELNLVTEEILRVRDIVRNLLDFSRQGNRDAGLSPLSLNDTVTEVLTLLHHQLISAHVEVKLSLVAEPVRVLGNKNQLKQVFINLLMNAIHAMETEPRLLQIGTAVKGEVIEATVRDTGIGIPQENLLRIFEPFYTTKSAGTGLGLSISYGLIKDHKGSIEVESQMERGSCFTVKLPRLSEAAMNYSQLVG